MLKTRQWMASFGLFLLALPIFAQTPEAKQVEIYGQKIAYVEAGASTNPTVILLHGLGGDATNWAQTIPALAAKYHVLVPDQIGFGKSDKPVMNYRVATLVEFLAAFCKKLGVERASLVGNSLGGWTAAAFTIAHPDKVEKLVLVDAAGYSSKRWNGPPLTRELLLALNPSTVADMKELFSRVFYNPMMRSDLVVEQAFAGKLKRGDGQTINAFIDSFVSGSDELDGKTKTIKAPTLVVWGREDGLTPLAIGEAFAADIPGAQKVVLDKCGHVPQLEKPAEFNAALLKFLAGASSSAQAR